VNAFRSCSGTTIFRPIRIARATEASAAPRSFDGETQATNAATSIVGFKESDLLAALALPPSPDR
jgi:hypothetical protein